MDNLFLFSLLAISAPHLLYAFIWFYPGAWRRRFGSKSVSSFADVAAAGKVVQFSAAAVWFLARGGLRGLGAAAAPQPLWVPCLAGIAFGQILNVGIYKAIGKAGVYYGFKLGQPVPWCHDFPFNLGIKHPQYVGSVLTVWGVGGLLWAAAPPGFSFLLLFWTLLYLLTAAQEEYC